MIRHLGRMQHSVWVTKQLNKSRSTAAVRFPNRLLCTYDDTLKNVTSFFLFPSLGFGLFRLFFQAAKVTGDIHRIFYFKRQKNASGLHCHWIPRPMADYRHFGLEYWQLWVAAIKSIIGVHHILQIYRNTCGQRLPSPGHHSSIA